MEHRTLLGNIRFLKNKVEINPGIDCENLWNLFCKYQVDWKEMIIADPNKGINFLESEINEILPEYRELQSKIAAKNKKANELISLAIDGYLSEPHFSNLSICEDKRNKYAEIANLCGDFIGEALVLIGKMNPEYFSSLKRKTILDEFIPSFNPTRKKVELSLNKSNSESVVKHKSKRSSTIFKEESYLELYKHLEMEYSDAFPGYLPTKYSNLYHFFIEEEYMIEGKADYKKFVYSEFQFELKDVIDQTGKYDSKIHPFLFRHCNQFLKEMDEKTKSR